MLLQFPTRRHVRASIAESVGTSGKQSSAVTMPSVSALSAAAMGADSQDLRLRMRLTVERSHETPRARMRAAMASSSSPRSAMKSASCMAGNVHQAHIAVKTPCARPGMENREQPVHDTHTMPNKRKSKPLWRPTYLRQWRDSVGKTLEEVAPKMGIKHSQLSRVERGIQPYNQRILETAALEYGCTIVDLLERNPEILSQRRTAGGR